MTTSSRAQFPARSPMPLMVHSIWPAPFSTPARALAVAMPRSSWVWVEMTTSRPRTTSSRILRIRAPYSWGVP